MKKRKEMSDTAVCNTYGKNAKALIDAIKKLSETQGLDTVFTTFLELTAVCLRATSDPEHREADQKRYAALLPDVQRGVWSSQRDILLQQCIRRWVYLPMRMVNTANRKRWTLI